MAPPHRNRPPEEPPPSNVARLRDRIDHGKTADKVDFPDPAAAPLGTDDEAAGRPPSDRRVTLAAKNAPRPATPVGNPDEAGERTAGPVMIGAVLLTALGVGAVLWMVL